MKLPVEESEFIPCDVLDAVRYLRQRNPAAAVRFVEAFKSSVDLLSRMPHLGRLRPDLGAPDTILARERLPQPLGVLRSPP